MIDALERKENKLAEEKSPYLLQHKNNPVNWYPWGEEAFEKALKEDKPIFLSIGYSTCHWCHVMERESFEDEEVADVLNKHFISIKVDREERPDIDSIYMKTCQIMTGSGGWPLSVFLTNDKKPFFVGTYFPKENKYGRQGFVDILKIIAEAWHEKREELIKSSNDILKAVNNYDNNAKKDRLNMGTVHSLYRYLESYHDKKYGGFGSAPKFPTPHYLLFLMRYYKATFESDAIKIVENSLDSMYKGGIFDHVGFGFARYSTDSKWLAPHFEKMLYDNALLALTYSEAYLCTGRKLYKEVSEKVFKYIIGEMQSELGGFYTAEDADSEGVEGKYYIWTREEIIGILGKENGELYCSWYDITSNGNFEGRNIPNLINSNISELEEKQDIKAQLTKFNEMLYQNRKNRIPPYKDDKILTSWNGLMIAALSFASRAYNNKDYLKASEKALYFILNNLVDSSGRLLARYREGDASIKAYIDDYAFLIWGLIETYEASFNTKYLEKAIKLYKDMIKIFWDKKNGGFFLYGNDSEQLISRPKEIYDGAIPSGNSTAAIVMLKLYSLTSDEQYKESAETLLDAFSGEISNNSMSYVNSITALLMSIEGYKQIVISGNGDDNTLQEMIKLVNEDYLPFTSILLNDKKYPINQINNTAYNKLSIDNKPTLYMCDDNSCKEPLTSIEMVRKLLKSI